MSQKTKHEASMSRLPGNRSAKFVPYLIPGLIGLFAVVVVPFIWNIYQTYIWFDSTKTIIACLCLCTVTYCVK